MTVINIININMLSISRWLYRTSNVNGMWIQQNLECKFPSRATESLIRL